MGWGGFWKFWNFEFKRVRYNGYTGTRARVWSGTGIIRSGYGRVFAQKMVTGPFFARTRVPDLYPGSGTGTPGIGYGRAGHGLPLTGIINTLLAIHI